MIVGAVGSLLQRFLQQAFAFRTPRPLATYLYGQVQFLFKFYLIGYFVHCLVVIARFTLTQTGLESNMGWQLLVTFKIDQNKNQNRSIEKVPNLGNERTYIYKDPRQDSGQRNISYTRYPKKCFTQTYRDLYGDAMLVLTWMSSNMADGNQQKQKA